MGLVKKFQYSAAERGIEWGLDDESVIAITEMPCHYCGAVNANHSKQLGISYNGIDRIDSSKGYVAGNVLPCCGICNQMKMDLPYQVFLNAVRTIAARFSNLTFPITTKRNTL